MTNLKMNGKYTTIKTIDCSNPKTVKEVPERTASHLCRTKQEKQFQKDDVFNNLSTLAGF